MDRELQKYIESLTIGELEEMKTNVQNEINFTREHQEAHLKEEFLPKYEKELSFIEEVMNSTWNVYSSMLGGFSAMGFKERKDAQKYITDFHCDIEKKQMSVSRQESK